MHLYHTKEKECAKEKRKEKNKKETSIEEGGDAVRDNRAIKEEDDTKKKAL